MGYVARGTGCGRNLVLVWNHRILKLLLADEPIGSQKRAEA